MKHLFLAAEPAWSHLSRAVAVLPPARGGGSCVTHCRPAVDLARSPVSPHRDV